MDLDRDMRRLTIRRQRSLPLEGRDPPYGTLAAQRAL